MFYIDTYRISIKKRMNSNFTKVDVFKLRWLNYSIINRPNKIHLRMRYAII